MNKQNINWKAATMKMNKECKNTRKKTKQHRSKKLKDKNIGK
jgi:hypothetical protein